MVAIDDSIKALKSNGLILIVMEELQDYLSWKITYSEDKQRFWLGQTHLIKNMEKKFHACRMIIVTRFLVCLKFGPWGLWSILKRFHPKISRNIGWMWVCCCTWFNVHAPILPTQPGNYQKKMIVQNILPARNSYITKSMFWTQTTLPHFKLCIKTHLVPYPIKMS